MSKQEYKKGDKVVLADDTVVVVESYNKGWYKTKTGESFRAKQVIGYADPDQSPDEAETRNMSKILRKYAVGYEPSISVSGRKSLNTGDDVAHMLSGAEPFMVVKIAERALGLEAGELWAKYEHLNRGQQRMNAGNRLRAAIKRGDITIEDVKKAVKGA